MQLGYDLCDEFGRYIFGFVPSKTAYDQVVQIGHKSMTNFFMVIINKS